MLHVVLLSQVLRFEQYLNSGCDLVQGGQINMEGRAISDEITIDRDRGDLADVARTIVAGDPGAEPIIFVVQGATGGGAR